MKVAMKAGSKEVAINGCAVIAQFGELSEQDIATLRAEGFSVYQTNTAYFYAEPTQEIKEILEANEKFNRTTITYPTYKERQAKKKRDKKI